MPVSSAELISPAALATVGAVPEFRLDSAFTPTPISEGDRVAGRRVGKGERFQTLLGATGTGKTMTMAGVIELYSARRW